MWENSSLFLTEGLASLYMTVASTAVAYLLGIPLGILLVKTAPDGLTPNRLIYRTFDVIINIFRSIPFLILMMLVMPVLKLVVGFSTGIHSIVIILIVGATPFVARMVESSLREVDHGVIEAALAMGADHRTILWKVMLREAVPSLIVGATISAGTILGYSAMAGVLGAGGLGTVATNYGWYRYQYGVMVIAVVLLIVMFQLIQLIGMAVAKRIDKRR
ncbi:MAG: methionine ABC transporter permease [Eubacteriales bacterium]|nr:methionine ABC transporter permease [Eubacteriales bacterium]